MRAGQRAYFAPDRTDVGGLTAIQTLALVEYGAAHSLFLYIVIVAINHSGDFVYIDAESLSTSGHIVSLLGLEVCADLREHLLTVVLVGVGRGSLCISTSVTEVVYSLLQFVVVHLVAVFAFHLFAVSLHHLVDSQALGFDSLVCGLDSLQHDRFGHFFHLALYHHDIVVGSSHHQFEVSLFALFKSRVDDHLTVHACYTHLRYRTFKRYIRASECCTGSKPGDRLRHINTVSRVHRHIHKSLCVIVGWEQRTERTVNQAGNQDFVVRSLALTTGKTAGETTCASKFLFVLNGKRHEVRTGNCVLGGADSGKHHSVANRSHHSTVGLFRQFTGLERNDTTIRKLNFLFYDIHFVVLLLEAPIVPR